MSTADLFDDSWPHTHGTVDGYDGGCKASICPAGTEYGLSCKIAKSLSRNDFKYQRLAKAGATVAEIAAEFGLVGTANAPAPKTKATKKRTPTPATARGGRSLADAAETATAAAEKLVDVVAELDQQIPDPLSTERPAPTVETTAPTVQPASIEEAFDIVHDVTAALDEARRIREAVGPLRLEDGTLNTRAIAEEATLRQRAGLPAWIADLDAPPSEPDVDEPVIDTQPAPLAEPTSKQIREWARSRGYEIGEKGRIPAHIRTHYDETHAPGTPNHDEGRAVAWGVDLADPVEDTVARAQQNAEGVLTVDFIVTQPVTPDEPTRPDYGHMALLQDLNTRTTERDSARRIAVSLEQELARAEAQIAEFQASAIERLEQLAAAEAARQSSANALELTLTKWATERAANTASYGVIIEQAMMINNLVDASEVKDRIIEKLLARLPDAAPDTHVDSGAGDDQFHAAAAANAAAKPWWRR